MINRVKAWLRHRENVRQWRRELQFYQESNGGWPLDGKNMRN